ncbi:uncharacterized protein [Haliotis cracherodii]|uniref:uncharacterized protein n=1 Tax=Haliotis cracherodii TaxID=6455 RepID=UPI0039EBB790
MRQFEPFRRPSARCRFVRLISGVNNAAAWYPGNQADIAGEALCTRFVQLLLLGFDSYTKPKRSREKCLRWIKACGRSHDQLNVNTIFLETYVCSKALAYRHANYTCNHGNEETGPTDEFPDPVLVDGSTPFKARKKRKITTKESGATAASVEVSVQAHNILPVSDPRVLVFHRDESANALEADGGLGKSRIERRLSNYTDFTFSLTSLGPYAYHLNYLYSKVDSMTISVDAPKRPIAQQSTYSTYKNGNTIKIVVGSTSGGLVSYVSPAYGGSTSDRQIVERSGLTVMCDPGDSIMAVKGFNVQDIFAPKDVTINMPTFFSKKNRMSGKNVMPDRKISSKRVHIERIVGLAKTFKILTEPLNSSETKLATEITTVCFMLCSFKKCIVPSTC